MIRITAVMFYVTLLSPLALIKGYAGTHHETAMNYSMLFQQDTDDTTKLDTIKLVSNRALVKGIKDSLGIRLSAVNPHISVQQMLKGNIAGVYVQETTGEPGTEQSMLIRGLSSPLFNKNDIYSQQPMVYVNGIPLIQESAFVYDIQKYDFNRIGPANNLLSAIDINNVSSIEIIKDPAALAKLGPNAANGAIWITTKAAKSGYRELSINSYFGMVQESDVSTVNAQYENNFRKPFYQQYASQADYLNYVGYLRDSTNVSYYGPSKWNDVYYKNAPIYAVDLGLTGGSERANFRFFGTAAQSAGNADETSLNRYAASFQINMAPFSWLTASSMINATRLDRNRNRNLRDRYAETRYIPDLYNPISPDADTYRSYLDEHKKNIDENLTTAVTGYLSLRFNLNAFNITSSLNFDWNQGTRDVFYPTSLMEGNNYVSNYLGFNQRMIFNNALSYKKSINEHSQVFIEGGFSIQGDQHRYNYANAYNGPNDFIKINIVDGDVNKDIYLKPVNYLVYRYRDAEHSRLVSAYASAKYSYKDLLSFNALIRNDGSTNAQPGSRWLIAPAANLQWNLKNQFLKETQFLNKLNMDVSWSRIGKPFMDDRFAAGPQYRVEMGWDLEPTIPGYNGVAGSSRPYSSGWVGYDLKWAYVDQLNVGLDASFFNNRLNASATFYKKADRRMVINIPVPAETGFIGNFASGMGVDNTGIDLGLEAAIVRSNRGFSWTSGFNLNFNRNKLASLPGGLDQLVIGDRKLIVGESIDQFWLYQNDGIYKTDADVPLNANGGRMAFEGTALKAGDPIWKDVNGDLEINEEDKALAGHSMPKLFGGFNNEFKLGNFDLNFNIIFALGQKALNQTASAQYNFINREAANDINTVKEIYGWQVNVDTDKYPIYNPWSSVVPYRLEQSLFLENASYAKLRTVSIGYDLSKTALFKNMGSSFKRAYIYVTGNNLLTVSPFSGSDPELINYNGIYNGYGMPIPRTYTVGVKLDL